MPWLDDNPLPTGVGGGGVPTAGTPSVFWGTSTARTGKPIPGPAPRSVMEEGRLGPAPRAVMREGRSGGSGAPPSPRQRVTKEETKSLDEAKAEFYRWTPEERREWGEHLADLGLIDETDAGDWDTLSKMWDYVTTEAANLFTSGHKLTPYEAADLIAGSPEDRAKRAGQAGRFTGTKTISSVDLTDPQSAKAIVNDVLAQALGRAALPEEMSQFLGTLSAAERANPTVTSTTYSDGDAVSSTTSGGLGAAGARQTLLESAQAKPDYGAYQAATLYFDALSQAVQSPV